MNLNISRYVLASSLLLAPVFITIGQQCEVLPASLCQRCSRCGTPGCTSCVSVGIEDQTQSCSACKNQSNFCTAVTRQTDEGNDDAVLCIPTYTGFIPRSQGTNTARELVGWEEFIHQFDVGDYYLTTGHVLSYSRSFYPERIARELFGDTVLCFAGSQVEDRGPCELLADNFGLSPNMRGSVSFSPLIENIIFDNQFFLGLDPILCGLYVRVHIPIVHTRWDLRMCQNITSNQQDCKDFPACYMSEDETAASCNIIESLSGRRTFGDMQQPWKFGRILNGAQTKTGVADIDLIVGYDFCQTDTYHLGFYGQLVLPTGNRYTGRQIFQPMVGNAKHVELGIGFSSHIVLLEHDAESNLAFYLEGNVVHMFKNTQRRSFDFCRQGPLSRYMLLKEVIADDGQFQYSGNIINAIDFTTRAVSVSVAAKGDISAKLAVRTPRIIADIGYNFFGQTKERISCKKFCDDRTFVVKGTEGVCGLEYATVADPPPVRFGSLVRKVPLNSSQSEATLRRGAATDNPQTPDKVSPSDIVVTAFSRQTGAIAGPDVIEASVSQPPKLVTTQDFDLCSGTFPAQATHKVFGYIGYNCFDLDWCANPYFGIGGEIEFNARSIDERTALNQWSVFLKAGFEF